MLVRANGSEPGLRYLMSLFDPLGASRALELYRVATKHHLFTISGSGESVVGCIGVEVIEAGDGVIRHLVVALEHRRRGYARALVQGAIAALDLTRLEADVEWTAAAFFREIGFRVWSLTLAPHEDDAQEEDDEPALLELYRCVWTQG